MKRKYKELCYYCGDKACTDEHAPPKQMFKGFSCDSITVPSCQAHNTSKSGTDQAIVSAFLIPLFKGQEKYRLEDDVVTAIQKGLSSFERTKYKAIDSPLLKDSPWKFRDLPNLAYLVPSVNIRSWVRNLTAALVWDATKSFDPTIQWAEAGEWSPDWIASDGPASLELEQAVEIMKEHKNIRSEVEKLPWINGWSAYPRSYPHTIYNFQILIREGMEIVFKHKFYNRYSWYVWFVASHETIVKIIEMTGKSGTTPR